MEPAVGTPVATTIVAITGTTYSPEEYSETLELATAAVFFVMPGRIICPSIEFWLITIVPGTRASKSHAETKSAAATAEDVSD